MLSKLASKTAEKFMKNDNTLYDKIEIYQYGFFILYSNLAFLILASIFGAMFNVLLQSIIFFFMFFSIRQFAGGYHAATETRCDILSTLSIVASIGIIKLSKIYDFKTILLFITVVSMVLIFFLCPLDTPEKPLSEKEFKYFRKISWIILLVISSIIIVSYFFKFDILFTPCCVSLILESILLVAGKIKRVHQEKSVKN
mgnify:CR=1 FL=1